MMASCSSAGYFAEGGAQLVDHVVGMDFVVDTEDQVFLIAGGVEVITSSSQTTRLKVEAISSRLKLATLEVLIIFEGIVNQLPPDCSDGT